MSIRISPGLLFLGLIVPSIVHAATFEPAAIHRTVARAKAGTCLLPDDRETQKKLCAFNGNPSAKAASVRVIATKSGVDFKFDGRTVAVKKGKALGEVIVNGHSLMTAQIASFEDMRKQIMLAIQIRKTALNFWLPEAQAADGDEVYASTLIAQLVTESQELGACAVYRDFGLRCAKVLGKVLNQVTGEGAPSSKKSGIRYYSGRYNEKADLLFVHGDLVKIEKSVKETMLPALNSKDLAMNCAAEAKGGFPALQPLAAKENLKTCERMVTEVAQLTNSYDEKDAAKVAELRHEIAQMTGSVITQGGDTPEPKDDGVQ